MGMCSPVRREDQVGIVTVSAMEGGTTRMILESPNDVLRACLPVK
jgi:hypothetical protein